LLSTEYTRSKDKLTYICSCGILAEISYDKFSQGQSCLACKKRKISSHSRHTIEFVRKGFTRGGCTLLASKYTGNKQRLDYICECGNVSKISFSKFKAGQRCHHCKRRKISEKLTGPLNPSWRHDLTEEDRIKERTMTGYDAWRRKVFERDDYTCQCCGIRGGRLNAHHIESYARYIPGRTTLDNGVTLCEPCHKQYHRDFYRNDATAESFREFMCGEYREPWYAGEREVV